MDIAVVGAGYVGLVTGSFLAYLGNKVVIVDANQQRLNSLKSGSVPFFEPGLNEFLKESALVSQIEYSDDLDRAVKKSDVIFIAVGTPSLTNGEPDLSQVMNVAHAIGRALDDSRRRIVVNKSTVPVGSGNWVEMLVTQGVRSLQTVGARTNKTEINKTDLPRFSVVSNPEFLREGSAIQDSLYPDRIVIGSSDEWAIQSMRELYQPVVEQTFDPPAVCPRPKDLTSVPFVVTDLVSAELIKYSANAFLALKISFANEIAGLCEKAGGDIREVMRGIGFDRRIGKEFLHAGIGWGGSCFGKDINALITVAKEYQHPTPILESTIAVNQRQRLILINKLQEELKIIKGRTIGLMGLAFKPNTDDLRDAPSLTIAQQLIKMGAQIKAYDPVSHASCRTIHPDLDIQYCDDLEQLASGSDALLLVTEWEEFKRANWRKLAKAMKTPLIIDGRNALNQQELVKFGFIYRGVGH